MTEEPPVDYEALYKAKCSECDALTGKLTEYIDANNKLSADLKVSQLINSKTLGTSNTPPSDGSDKSVSLGDAIEKYKKSLKG